MALEFEVRGGRVGTPKPLQSEWGGLSDGLIATITALNRDGEIDDTQPEVRAPLMDGASLTGTPNWQSPFENASPDGAAPAITALVQSGALSTALLRSGNATAEKFGSALAEYRGRTGVTKLNSTQIFTGMAPLTINMTLLFRAWSDPVAEVMAPLQQLWEWVVPRQLAEESLSAAIRAVSGALDMSFMELGNRLLTAETARSAADILLPSLAPTLVQFRFSGRLFDRMVIESIEEPITSSKDVNGRYVELALPITLATLTALDKKDMQAHFDGRRPIRGGRS